MKRMTIQRMGFALGIALLAIFTALPASAQISGGIHGKIIGPDGKPLQNAKVELTRTDITGHYEVKTNKKGEYGHYALPLGTYNISVVMPNGQTVMFAKNIKSQFGQPVEQDADIQKMMQVAAGEAPPPGMSKAEAAEYEKKIKEKEDAAKKLGKLNDYLAQNKAFVEAKQYDKAIAVMQEAIAIDQTHDILYANLAEDYANAKQYDKAVEAYQQALKLKPDSANYIINVGSILSKEGKTEEANAAFAKAAAMDPTQAKTAMYNSAVVMLNAGNLDGASAAFDKLLALDPTNANAWYYKGLCMLGKATTDPKTGKITPPAGTVEALQKSIQLAPNGPNAANAKAALQTLGVKG